MSTTVRVNSDYFAIIRKASGYENFNDHTSGSFEYNSNYENRAFTHFQAVADQYKYRKILSANLNIGYFNTWQYGQTTIHYGYLTEPFEQSVTHNTYSGQEKGFAAMTGSERSGYKAGTVLEYLKYAFQSGLWYNPNGSYQNLYTKNGQSPPYIEITFDSDNVSRNINIVTPGSITHNTALPCAVEATTQLSAGTSIAVPDIASAVLRYKTHGLNNVTEISLEPGNTLTYSLAGNLIPAAGLDYQFEITDQGGTTSTSSWYTLTPNHQPIISTLPQSGAFVARQNANSFTAELEDECVLNVFRYRVINAGSYSELTVSGNGITIPANTFGGYNYEYQFTATDRYGVSGASPWASFTCIDTNAVGTPVNPQSIIVDADIDNIFSWRHSNTSGSAQTAADLQISDNNSAWSTLATVSGAQQSVTVPANSFASGTHYWRVRTYNADSVAGAWSASVSFTAVGSPPAPTIADITATPRPVIRWQTSEQAAYELSLDGAIFRGFGSDVSAMSWKAPVYVNAGEHTVKVRVQNSLGLYSQWSTRTFTVNNTAGSSIILAVSAGDTAELLWSGGGYDFYIVYRNGEPIAKLSDNIYTDYFSIGYTEYSIRGGYSTSDNYGLSNSVAANIYPSTELLIDAETLDTVALQLTEEQYRTIQVSPSVQYGSYRLSGHVKPSVEVSPRRDTIIALTAAFEEPGDDAQVLAMLSRIVCIKTRKGRMATGVLTAIPIEDSEFYSVLTLSVTDSDWSEVIDIDTGNRL